VNITEVPIKLSERTEKRYLKMEQDFEKGKNVQTFSNIDELMKDLTS